MKTGQTEAVRIVRRAWTQASGHDGPAAAILWSALTYLNSTDPDRRALTGYAARLQATADEAAARQDARNARPERCPACQRTNGPHYRGPCSH